VFPKSSEALFIWQFIHIVNPYKSRAMPTKITVITYSIDRDEGQGKSSHRPSGCTRYQLDVDTQANACRIACSTGE
jgi:hypothetical protein